MRLLLKIFNISDSRALYDQKNFFASFQQPFFSLWNLDHLHTKRSVKPLLFNLQVSSITRSKEIHQCNKLKNIVTLRNCIENGYPIILRRFFLLKYVCM